jgi:hypothetical protein
MGPWCDILGSPSPSLTPSTRNGPRRLSARRRGFACQSVTLHRCGLRRHDETPGEAKPTDAFVRRPCVKRSPIISSCLQNRRCVTEIASHEIGACRHQLPRSLAIRLAGERLDAMSPGQQCARNRASLLAGSACDQKRFVWCSCDSSLFLRSRKLGMLN